MLQTAVVSGKKGPSDEELKGKSTKAGKGKAAKMSKPAAKKMKALPAKKKRKVHLILTINVMYVTMRLVSSSNP